MKTRVISFADSLPLFGKVAYSICEGVLGTILIFFLSTALFPLSLAVKIVPWAIGFNSAVTGYSLLNRTQDLFSHKFTYALVAGAVKVLITWIVLNIMFLYRTDGCIFYGLDLILFLIIGMPFSGLGALLAIKYSKIKKANKTL